MYQLTLNQMYNLLLSLLKVLFGSSWTLYSHNPQCLTSQTRTKLTVSLHVMGSLLTTVTPIYKPGLR